MLQRCIESYPSYHVTPYLEQCEITTVLIFQKYTSRDLRGLKVEHDINAFKEGQSVILTLKDRGKRDIEPF